MIKTEAYSNTLPNIDYDAFAKEVEALKQEALDNLGEPDFKHLKKIERWGKICTILGYGTSWLIPNPISAFLISQGIVTRWAMMTHHVSHKGYDRVPNMPERYTSKKYAKGNRRFLDWLEWMYPEAWNYEHNVLHHYHTGETKDPDLVEHVARVIRSPKMPTLVKYFIIFFYMSTWKFSYYAPNTLYHLKEKELKVHKKGELKLNPLAEKVKENFFPGLALMFDKQGLDVWTKCYLPYIGLRYGLIPLLFLPLGTVAYINVLINSLLAEIITNIHSFLIIVPNHAGEDLYRFDKPVSDKAEFYVRQVTGSVNYRSGTDMKDFLQGWLNYQIEHHVWPDLPMLKYRELQPKLQKICEKYQVPYIEENVFTRVIKTLRIITGKTSMLKTSTVERQARNEKVFISNY